LEKNRWREFFNLIAPATHIWKMKFVILDMFEDWLGVCAADVYIDAEACDVRDA
jgi:hypothetical protein